MASHPIYQFYVELDDYKPKIWRRFQVINNISMAKFGYIIMTMFEMKANHLFEFDVPFIDNFKNLMGEKAETEDNKTVINFMKEKSFKGIKISIDDDDEFKNSDYEYFKADTKINKFFSKKGDKATFAYDFGDGWRINILYEGLAACQAIHGSNLPKVFEGEGFGIVEDCGGTGGLEDITKAFKKKSGKAYQEYCDWLGTTELDLFMFDIDEMNVRIKKIPRIFADIYEKHLEPTKQSINLIERKTKTKLSAKDKWDKHTPEFKERIPNNAFCRNCGLTSIVNYTIKDDKHGIVLKGKCAKCGEDIARYVEDE